MSKSNYLLGFSGHALTVIDVIESMDQKVSGYFDNEESALNEFDFPFFGKESAANIHTIVGESDSVFPSVGLNYLRKKMHEFIVENKLNETILTHNTAIISPYSTIGFSTLIGAGAIVNAHATVGKGCILNTGSIVEHECKLGDYIHLGPGAVLAGNVSIGDLSFIGANSTVIQGVKIGRNVIVGAGSVVLEDIPDNTVYVGNPSKFLRKNE